MKIHLKKVNWGFSGEYAINPKVKALQHLLTHSFSGKALAVRRVTENQGKHH